MSLIDFFKKHNAVHGTIIPSGEMSTLDIEYENEHYFIVTGVYHKRRDGKLVAANVSDIFTSAEDFNSILNKEDKGLLMQLIRNNFKIDELVKML